MAWKWSSIFLKNEPSPFQNREAYNQKIFNWNAIMAWAREVGESLRNYSDSLDSKMSDYDDRFANQIKNATDSNSDLSEVVDARLSSKYGQFSTINKRMENVEALAANLDGNSVIGGTVADSNVSTLETLKKGIDQTKFNLVFITDVHYGRWNSSPTRLNNFTLAHLNNALYLDGKVDAIVFGGDNIDGWTMNKAEMVKEQEEFGKKALFSSNGNSDKFILKGNHDDASGNLYQYQNGDFDYLKWLDGSLGYSADAPKIISDSELKTAYHTNDLIFNEKRNGDSLYFYKDYPNKKVRLIGLNSNDDPDLSNSDGTPKYLGLKTMGYQQTQLDWLANTALQNVPSDYLVLIVGHIPATSLGADAVNQNLVNQIINSFQSGDSGTASGSTTDWEVNVNYDFTSQGERTVVAYVNGHLHAEYLTQNLGFDSVSITSSINSGTDSSTATGDDTDGWDVLTIDTSQKKIVLTGFGRATNRKATY